MIDRLIVYSRNREPGHRPALSGRQILHRVEAKAGKIRQTACPAAVISSAQSMSTVSQHDYPAKRFLYFVGRMKERPLPPITWRMRS